MSWTKVSKPSGSGTTTVGSPIGLLLSLTYATAITTSLWTKVAKASGTSWTKITKAT